MTIAERIARAKADYDEVFEAGKKSVLSVLDFSDIESNTYRVTVPSGADDFARVNKIGGMSYKTRNLIPFPYYFSSPQTTKGITITTSDSGAITINGTSDAEGVFFLVYNGTTTHLNGTYTLSGLTNGSNTTYYIQPYIDGQSQTPIYTASRTYTWNGTLTILGFYFKAGISFNNLTIYPMLNEGTTALPYEPYFEGVRNASVSELKSEGANLANITYDKSSWIFNSGNGTVISTTENSIVGEGVKGSSPYAPYASNGWLTQRESTAKITQFKRGERISLSYDFEILELPADYNGSTITIGCGFGFIGNYSASLWKQININFALGIQKVSVTFDVTDVEANLTPLIRIAFSSLHAKVSNIMINYGDVTSYKPYREGAIDTLPIPEAIKSIEGYGLGVNSEYYNYIDFERKVFVQKVKAVDMGTLKWSYRFSNDRHIFATGSLFGYIQGLISSAIPINALSADYRAVTVDSTWVDRDMAYNSSKVGNTTVEFVDNRYTDADTFKNAVNGKILVYALAEPIETDISAYLKDEYIEVEGGGTVTAVNEYGLDAPTNISYLIDTQGG